MLFAHVFSEIITRGYRGYVVWLDPTTVLEQRLMNMITRIGGQERPERQVLWYGYFSFLQKGVAA